MVIPMWLEEHILSECPYCGAPITNNESLTDRYCSNPQCPEHMAHKIDVLAKRFGRKGFGVATARSYIRQMRFSSHLDILRIWFPDRLELELHEIGEICLIKGHQKKWRSYCDGYNNMLELVSSRTLPADVQSQSRLLLQAAVLCKVKPSLQGMKINIMMSGSFSGYRSRKDFVTEMNNKYGAHVQLVDVGKRKTGVDFLVKEDYTTDHEKSAIARSAGICIITPHDMEEKLKAFSTYISERRSAE